MFLRNRVAVIKRSGLSDNGIAVDQAVSAVGVLETRKMDFEALLEILGGAKMPGDFLRRRQAINDDQEGGNDA